MSLNKLSLGFVILTRNRVTSLENCLKHLFSQHRDDFECVVVDNSDISVYANVESICKKYPVVSLIQVEPSPRIHSTGRNAGAAQLKTDIIAFLDDDSYVNAQWVETCRNVFEDATIGAVSGPIDDPEVQDLDHHRDAPIGIFGRNGELLDNYDIIPKTPFEITHVRGCNWAIRRSIFEACRGFDEQIFATYCFEEMELCLQVKQQGFRILFHPMLGVYHDMKPPPDSFPDMHKRIFQMHRSLTRIYLKHRQILNFSIWRYLLFFRTYVIAFFRKPNLQNLRYVYASLAGKAYGFFEYFSS